MKTDQMLRELHKWMGPSQLGNGFDLTDEQYRYVASYGDGFGSLTVEQMDELGVTYDWSHVRDSSDEAVRQMHMALGRVVSNMVTF